jgi:hypothetical protein
MIILLFIGLLLVVSLISVYHKLKLVEGEKHPLDFFLGELKIYRHHIGGTWYKVQLLSDDNAHHIAIPIQKIWVRHKDMSSIKMRYYVVKENIF